MLDLITFRVLPSWVEEFIHYHSGFAIFTGNIFNLQNFFVPFFGSDGPIGTLAMEMWYYLSFPLLLAGLAPSYRSRWKWAFLLPAIAANIALGIAQPAYLLGFVIWGIGAVARVSNRTPFRNPAVPGAIVVVVLLLIRAVMRRNMSTNMIDLFIADLFLASSLFILLVTLKKAPEADRSFFLWGIHKDIASFSYSLYAIHMPSLFLLTAICKSLFGFGTKDVVAHEYEWLYVAAAIAACIAIAYFFSLGTERNTKSARQLVFGILRTLEAGFDKRRNRTLPVDVP